MNPQAAASSSKKNSDKKKGRKSPFQNPHLDVSDWSFQTEEVYKSLSLTHPDGKDPSSVTSSSSGKNPEEGDGILNLPSSAKGSGTPRRTGSRSDPGILTGPRPRQPLPKRSSKPKRGPCQAVPDYPQKLHGTRGKAERRPRSSRPQRSATLDVEDLELLDFLLREEDEHSKCRQTKEGLVECGAKTGTSSVCQSQDRQQTLDRLLQMSPHAEIYDVDFLQVENCLCLTCWIEKLASSNLPAKNIAGA